MFKVKHGICPTYVNLQTTPHSLKNSEFVIPGLNTVIDGKHSIKYLGLHYGTSYLRAQEMQVIHNCLNLRS